MAPAAAVHGTTYAATKKGLPEGSPV